MDFTAIDFETASNRRDSACQLAAVRVRGGEIVDQACWLIRPEPFYFSDANIRVHGIRPQDVQDEMNFGDRWSDIRPWLAQECLVAHNAAFDIGVMVQCLRAHRRTIPEFQFTCTRAVSRRAWPGRPGYGLKPMSDFLGVAFKHHDALEDSIACAKVLLAAAETCGATSIDSLESALLLSRGGAGDWGYRGVKALTPKQWQTRRAAITPTPLRFPTGDDDRPTGPGQRRVADQCPPPIDPPPIDRDDLQRLLVRGEFIRPLRNRRVMIWGTLRSLNADEVTASIGRLGGCCVAESDASVDLVVIGDAAPAQTQRSRWDAAATVISEAEFFQRLIRNDLDGPS